MGWLGTFWVSRLVDFVFLGFQGLRVLSHLAFLVFVFAFLRFWVLGLSGLWVLNFRVLALFYVVSWL